MTLCLVVEEERVLLGYKKRGFGQGWWNGFGGKVEIHETVAGAALREVHEEAGIRLAKIILQGVLDFTFEDKPDEILQGHIFRGEGINGQPWETDEMMPQWFHVHEIPYEFMWPADRFWLPAFLEGKSFTGKINFDVHKEIVSKNIFFHADEKGLV